MQIKHVTSGDVAVLHLQGKIMGGPDATSLHEKLHELIETGTRSVVIDLTDVDWMNSSGLGILIGGLSAIRKSGGDLRLASVTEKIEEVLRITKLDRVFDVYGSTEDAVTSYDS
ncbi:STAS domain-containing protein [Candidatus Zixiibacteriota bacterium]